MLIILINFSVAYPLEPWGDLIAKWGLAAMSDVFRWPLPGDTRTPQSTICAP